MELQERVDLFVELIAGSHPLFYWRYDGQGDLLHSTCPSEQMFDSILRGLGGLDYIYSAQGASPLVLNNEFGLLWLAGRETGEGQVHVLGPFFAYDVHAKAIEQLTAHIGGKASPQWLGALDEALKGLPTVSMPFYCQYAVMLHYLLSGERVSVSAIQYQAENRAVPTDFSNLKTHVPAKDRILIYRAERALLNAVREGDVDGAAAMAHAASVARVRQYTDDPLKNVQIACTTFVTLCTRAAIEGGLSTTMSYCLGDAYIKSIFQAKSPAEVAEIKNQMYTDLITRVHACRNNPQYSKMVQASCDYIELHLSEPLNIELLASRLGYAKYYLSTRFKKETGCSVNDYIKFARIERAKMLLSTTTEPIADIAEKIGFLSRSFFANTFKQCVGKTPAQYRKEKLST